MAGTYCQGIITELCDKCLLFAQEYTEAALARGHSTEKKPKVDAAWEALEAHMATHKTQPVTPQL